MEVVYFVVLLVGGGVGVLVTGHSVMKWDTVVVVDP